MGPDLDPGPRIVWEPSLPNPDGQLRYLAWGVEGAWLRGGPGTGPHLSPGELADDALRRENGWVVEGARVQGWNIRQECRGQLACQQVVTIIGVACEIVTRNQCREDADLLRRLVLWGCCRG